MMNYKTLILASVALMTFSHNGWTDMADDDAEATIRLMGTAEAQSSDDVIKVISLPDRLLDAEKDDQVAAVEKAKEGLQNATDNVNKDLPDSASQQARDARDQAKNNRESRGRSEEAPGRPDDPGRPDNPGTP